GPTRLAPSGPLLHRLSRAGPVALWIKEVQSSSMPLLLVETEREPTHRSPVPVSPREVQRGKGAPLLTVADQSKQTPYRPFARREVSSVCQCQAPGTRQTGAAEPAGCSHYRSSPGRSAQLRRCRGYPWHRPPEQYPSHFCPGLSAHDAVVRGH